VNGNPMKKRASSIDVAQEAGVSQSTVSLVLNGKAMNRIPEETRQRVFEAARKLNYRPNVIARELVTGRTRRIGIVPNQPASFLGDDLYYSKVLVGVLQGALRHNYNILLHSADYPDWMHLHKDIVGGATDGVVLIGRYPEDALTNALCELGFPAVCISYHPDKEPYYSVDCDNEQGGYLAVQYLLALGHREIAFFFPGDTISWGRERHEGALRAMREAEVPEENLHVLKFAYSPDVLPDSAELLLREILLPERRYTAAIFCDEWTGLQALECLTEFGLRVPEDLSIINFNSTEVSARARPALTSVWQPLTEIGEAGFTRLIDLVEGREVTSGVIRFPMRLDVRESCGPPGRRNEV
jgi:LacI family transcriptional regulator